MQVQIKVKGLPESAKLRRFAAQKLTVALSRFAHCILEVSMQLNDINGPNRGGVDKLCRVVLKMKNSSLIVIEELATDIAQAVIRATDRLQQGAFPNFSHLLATGQRS